jgi:hypothetical protein
VLHRPRSPRYRIRFQDINFNSVAIERHEYDWEYADFYTIHLAEELPPTTDGRFYILNIPFHGVMSEDRAGVWYAPDGPNR